MPLKNKSKAQAFALKNKLLKAKEKLLYFCTHSIKKIILNKRDILVQKFRNLPNTNYNVGLLHLKKGNLWDATCRFTIMTKFWPEYHKASYQLAYCLVLRDMDLEAQVILEKLVKDFPKNAPAKTLLKNIKDKTTDKVREDYKKFK